MEELYRRIRRRRRELGLTQQQLADELHYERSSIAKIEKGEVDLPLSKILAFSRILSLPPMELLGLDEAGQEWDTLYAALNESGRAELLRLGRELAADAEYSLVTPFAAARYIRYYRTAAAAGYAAPVEGEDYELIPCGAEVPPRADYCIDIAGDSMEPYIADGAVVLVRRSPIQTGDVGLFFVDGDMKCKQYVRDSYGNVYLVSLNRDRADADVRIPASSGVTLCCFGKVMLEKRPPLAV
jgi:phage repressor protein C with HTH and peptisase S24 domain/DNA-binding XRE family transcriptional regulator